MKSAYAWIISCAVLVFFVVTLPPFDYPTKSIITIPPGAGLLKASSILSENHAVRFGSIFRISVIVLGGETKIKAGDYYLPYLDNPFSLAWRLVHGAYDIRTVKVTIPEGYTDKQISFLFDATRFPFFDQNAFIRLAPQGYMFPDTYFAFVDATATSTIRLMRSNYEAEIAPLRDLIAASGHSEEDILTMASILEAEVPDDPDRRLVSGILWKRLALGMPLQVDSAPVTYTSKGLPPSPINNPGLDSIKAALGPTASPYLYFLTDQHGKVHYAETFAEHETNVAAYLSH